MVDIGYNMPLVALWMRCKQGGHDHKGTPGDGGGIRMGRLRTSSMSSLTASLATKGGVSKGGIAGYGDADVAKLKDAIQMLCQSTHPLGQYDFVDTNVYVRLASLS